MEPAAAIRDLGIEIYSDGADVDEIVEAYRTGMAHGFTTNPTLMAKAGVPEYRAFAKEVLEAVPDLPISFEVFADDARGIASQAREISSWGPNVYVKVPVCNTSGESSAPIVRELTSDGLKLNVTAVLALEQVEETLAALTEGVPAIISIFAGRVADTGRDPMPHMRRAVEMCSSNPDVRVLWASPREVLNVYQAAECGCHLIALTPDLIRKLPLKGKDLGTFSRETVEMFYDDAQRAGYTL